MERYDYFKIRYRTDMFHNHFFNILDFQEGVARVVKENFGSSYIDKNGKLIMPYHKNTISGGSFYKGTAVRTSYYHSPFSPTEIEIFDKSGEVIFQDHFKAVHDFDEEFITLQETSGIGCIDRTGNQIIPFIYEELEPLCDGLFRARKDGKWGYLDVKGNIVIPFVYDCAMDFYKGVALVKQNGKLFYINKKGKNILPFSYQYQADFGRVVKNGVAIVRDSRTRKYGVVRLEKEIIPLLYDNILSYDEGFAVKKGEKWGWLDQNGCEVMPCIYEKPLILGEELFVAFQDGKYGYIDKNGKVVIPFMYRSAEPFKDGFAIVINENGLGFINKENEPFILEEEAYVSTSADIPSGAFNIKIEEYLSAFLIEGKIVFIRDTNYEKYRQKLKKFLVILERNQKDNLGMIYQEIFERNEQAKKV